MCQRDDATVSRALGVKFYACCATPQHAAFFALAAPAWAQGAVSAPALYPAPTGIDQAAVMAGQEGSLELFVPGRLCLFGEHSDWAGAMRK